MEINLMYVIGIVSVLVALYVYLTHNNDFFKKYPIPCLPVEPLFGSSRQFLLKKISFSEFVRSNYERFPNAKMYGMFEMFTPMFVIRDPELIKQITVKDFDHFINHRPLMKADNSSNSTAMFSKILFNLTGQRWRNVRTTLSPTFTGSKMRQMFAMILECSDNMVQALAHPTGRECEVKDLFIRFTNDVIASCAFGVHVNSFRDKDNVFFRYGKDLSNFSRLKVALKIMGYQVFPKLMAQLQMDIFDSTHVQFFTEMFRQSVQEREEHGIVRPDLIHLLIQARKGQLRYQPQESEETDGFATAKESNEQKILPEDMVKLSENEMIAQCLLFFLAGFDTIATSMTFVLYEVTLAPEIQQRLYEEIQQVSETLDGKALTYDALQGMRYLDMVVSETLRKWSPSPGTDRMCNQDYTIPGDPDIVIPKGATVFIPIAGLHYDPRFYPDPDRFDPERFNDENKHKIPLGAYLPFGIGPRNCIASRFALMEVKAIVYHILLNYELKRSERTSVPVKLAKGFSPLKPENGMYLKFNPRMKN
ncbi:AGAP012295-PA [Anopheles gambiae str. PEST]|uniref:AGAP012295-PA n=1 Tax=Anopheles gambiae TaxID=7165 RepID=Q8T624_ANOGA|nr:cytochrome P450 9e2 isoform X3 [Anopheles gambiae]AAL96668.1 cytochrome P450 CYP9L1 protein [Anopheles gambiae]EAA43283.1 AGAP012295-PA [Anopheles gambiae str. PEST]